MMAEHRKEEESVVNTMSSRPEPVVYANLLQALIALAVAFGWVKLDDLTVNAIATVVGVLVTGVITHVTRSQVTPIADPKTADGVPLVPLVPKVEGQS